MHEYYSEAIVLDTAPLREIDIRATVFTKRFGKIIAKVKSGRKPTSKLSPHIQPGNLIATRVVEKGGLQLVDVLKNMRLSHAPADLYLLSRLLHEGEPDEVLWKLLMSGRFSWRKVLPILGWDPLHATCHECKGKPDYFSVKRQEFFCGTCASKLGESEVISL